MSPNDPIVPTGYLPKSAMLLSVFCLFLISCLDKNKNRPKNDGYLYKFRVEVNSDSTAYQDKILSLDIDFNDKLRECRDSGKKVDHGSILVLETNVHGKVLDTCISQYDVNTLLWTMKGNTPVSTTRYYSFSFNTSDQKTITPSVKHLIQKMDLQDKWAFTTPTGYFVYEKKGGAFGVFAPEVCEDNENGKDWVRGDYKEYNGILNIGDPNTKAIFHPHDDVEADDGIWGGSKSDIIFEGPLHYQIRSNNNFGTLPGDYRSNTAYRILFDIYPNYIQATITAGNAHGYASVMEMTPGGDSLEATDYVVRSNGKKYLKGDTLALDISPEWFFAGDEDDDSNLFFIHKQDDDVKDGIHWYNFMQGLMIGYGRGANPGINSYPNEFYLGFTKKKDFKDMQAWVASISNTPKISVHKIQKQQLHPWGSIDIKNIHKDLELSLENTALKLPALP